MITMHQMQDLRYREWHIGKGHEYHARFSENPRLALIWSIEQRILADISKKFLTPGEVDHLDFACGTGRILAYMKDRVRSSTGVDVSDSMLKIASASVPKANIIKADITREAALGAQKFDLITAFRFFPNAEPNLRRDTSEALYHRLRKGGYLVFNNHRQDGSLLFRVGRLLKGPEYSPFSGMSAQEALMLIRSVGLDIEKIYHIGILPETEKRFIRPRFLVEWIESTWTRFPVPSVSENVIYVCRKRA